MGCHKWGVLDGCFGWVCIAFLRKWDLYIGVLNMENGVGYMKYTFILKYPQVSNKVTTFNVGGALVKQTAPKQTKQIYQLNRIQNTI